jgi:hypothetical protein
MTKQLQRPLSRSRFLLPVGLMAIALALGSGSAPATPPDPQEDGAGIEVQTRGPIHEAFARPGELKPEASPVVPKAPPEPIPEDPPELKPEGDNVQWISGYWSWDADRNDFVWVSGTWRVPPPDRQWVPGYWSNTREGWRWVPGFWAGTQQAEVPLLPAPPDTLENGPSVPAPGADYAYTPGVWVCRTGRWLWRPGYWHPLEARRVWVCAHYNWTPGGYIFVDGYWDYPLEDRGLLFAPVCFAQPLWLTPGWCYRPEYTVGIEPLLGALWVRPGLCQYYYGDWYGPRYAGLGFRPWHAYGRAHHDPLFSYYRWHHRETPGWEAGLRTTYLARSAGTAPLPPRTLAAQGILLAKQPEVSRASLQVVRPLHQLKTNSFKMTTVSTTQRAQQVAANQKLQQRARVRRTMEVAPSGEFSGTGKAGFPGKVLRLNGQGGSGGGRPVGKALPSGSQFTPGGIQNPFGQPNPTRAGFRPKTEGKPPLPPVKTLPKAAAGEKSSSRPKSPPTATTSGPPAKSYRPAIPKSDAPPAKNHAPAAPKTYAPPPKTYAPAPSKRYSPPAPKTYAPANPKTYAPPAKSYAPATPKSYSPPAKSYPPPAPKTYSPPAKHYGPSPPRPYSPPAKTSGPPVKTHAPPPPKTFAPPAKTYSGSSSRPPVHRSSGASSAGQAGFQSGGGRSSAGGGGRRSADHRR